MDRETLYERINNRVDRMMDDGLLDEVKQLIPFKHYNALQTVGYKELFAYFNNEIDLVDAVELIKETVDDLPKDKLLGLKNILLNGYNVVSKKRKVLP